MSAGTFAAQNPNLNRAIREPLQIQPVGTAPAIDVGQVELVHDVSQGGWLNPNVFQFQLNSVSLSGAAVSINLGAYASWSVQTGNAPPVGSCVMKLTTLALYLAGGAVTPLAVQISSVTLGSTTQHAESVTNPGFWNLTNVHPILSTNEINLNIGAGGVGDTARVSGTILWAPNGVEVPAL